MTRELSASVRAAALGFSRFFVGAAPVYLFASLLGRVGSLVLLPVYARHLSLVEYGDYGLAQTAVVAAAPMISLGLPAAVTRFYFEGNDRRVAAARSGAVARMLTVFAVGLAVASVVVLASIAPTGRGGLLDRRSLIDITLAACGGAIAPIPFAYFRAQQRPFAAVAVQVFDLLALAGFGVYFVAIKGAGLGGALDAMAATGMATSAVAIVYIWTRLEGRLSLSLFKEAARFSYPLLIQFYAQWFLNSADRWGLKLTHHDAQLGSYALAQQLSNPTSLPTVAWNDAEYARLGEISRTGGLRAVRAELPSARRTFLWLAGLPTVGLTLALPFLSLVVGKAGAVPPCLVMILACGLILDAQIYPNQNVLFFASKTHLLNRFTAVSIAMNAVALACLIPAGGAVGAAVARVLTSACRVCVMSLLVRRSLGEAEHR